MLYRLRTTTTSSVAASGSNGLGMKHVIDTLNSLYGEDFIKY